MLDIIAPLQAIVERGLIYSLIVIGVYLTSRIIKFDDLTVEGSFGLGGALTAFAILSGTHPIFIIPLSMVAGGLAGLCTGLLHTKLKINNLISGIVVTTGLFSINLKIAGANATIIGYPTLFDLLPLYLTNYKTFVSLIFIASILLIVVKKLLNTEVGYLIQAVGDNPQMLTNLGKNIHTYKITALFFSNMLTACAGSLFVQYVGYFSIWANIGILISALAGLILAELISSSLGVSLIVGSIVYQLLIAITFELQVAQEWNKLITAILIVILLSLKSHLSGNNARK